MGHKSAASFLEIGTVSHTPEQAKIARKLTHLPQIQNIFMFLLLS